MDIAHLKAQVGEDRQKAHGLVVATRFVAGEPNFYGVGGPAAAAFWGHFNEHRMLRDAEAKRAILDEYERDPQADDQYRAGLAFALERLAEAYEGRMG